MARGSKKPCPGCGKENTFRDADSVCSECQRKLDYYDRLEAQNKKLEKQGWVAVNVPERISLPRVSTDWRLMQETIGALRDLILSISREKNEYDHDAPMIFGEKEFGSAHVRLIRPEHRDALAVFVDTYIKSLASSYEQGTISGQANAWSAIHSLKDSIKCLRRSLCCAEKDRADPVPDVQAILQQLLKSHEVIPGKKSKTIRRIKRT